MGVATRALHETRTTGDRDDGNVTRRCQYDAKRCDTKGIEGLFAWGVTADAVSPRL
jgi:hypothetical protein